MLTFLKWTLLSLCVCVALLAAVIHFAGPPLRTRLSRPSSVANSRTEPDSKTLSPQAAAMAAKKIREIEESLKTGKPFGTVRFTEDEINSYIQYEMEQQLPAGISNVRVKFDQGRPHGTAMVNFDELRLGDHSFAGPVLGMLLKGVHTVGVDGKLSSNSGAAMYQTEAVTVDHKKVPSAAVGLLYDHYFKSRFPNFVMNAPFRLPPSVDKLSVESGSISVQGAQAADEAREKLGELNRKYKEKFREKALPAGLPR